MIFNTKMLALLSMAWVVLASPVQAQTEETPEAVPSDAAVEDAVIEDATLADDGTADEIETMEDENATLAQEGESFLEPSTDLIQDEQIANIRQWLENPVVEMSILAQNEKYAALPQSDIESLDNDWRTERESDDQPLISATLSSPLSNYLTQIQAASGGLFAEIFIMDAKGLNVGQSSITSDFWQGDEAKFQETFPKGKDAIFIDEAEFNEDTKTWRAQVNMTISQGNDPIGAITIEYNLTELARRLSAQ